MSDKKWLFTLILTDNGEIGSIASVAFTSFGEVGQYTREEITRLRKLLCSTPHPTFSKDPQASLANQDILVEFGKSLRAKLIQKDRHPITYEQLDTE